MLPLGLELGLVARIAAEEDWNRFYRSHHSDS